MSLSIEQGVRLHSWNFVEANVREIFTQILNNNDAKAILDIEGGVKFEDHLNSLNDTHEEVHGQIAKRKAKERPKERAFIPVDQFSIVERTSGNDADSNETTLGDISFLIEYKAAHKLTVATLQRVLGNNDFSIKDFINNPRKPDDEEGKKLHRSTLEVAAAISQLFGYMIQAGTEYGYITTGQSFLFLRVKESEPTTAYYHLAVPNEDVNEDADEAGPSLTSISQVLCFSLLARESRPRNQ